MRARDNRTLLLLISLMLIAILATLLSISSDRPVKSVKQSSFIDATAPQVEL